MGSSVEAEEAVEVDELGGAAVLSITAWSHSALILSAHTSFCRFH